MADAEREAERTGEREDAELVCEGWQCWLGIERFHRTSVNQLLACLAIRALNDMGETPQRFQIADTGRAILRRPQLEGEIKAALYAGQPFGIKGNRVVALRNGPSYLGRGHEDIAGKPFGWAHHEERDEIRAHLRRKHGYPQIGFDPRLEQHVSRIQSRLRRYRPTLRQRQEAARLANPPRQEPEEFSQEELERLAELFADANDPVTASIGRKAAARLATSPNQESLV